MSGCPHLFFSYEDGETSSRLWTREDELTSPHFLKNYFVEKRSGSEECSYLRLTDLCITQFWARE